MSLEKLSKRLFGDSTEREHFVSCFTDPKSAESSLIWLNEISSPFSSLNPLCFQPSWVQRTIEPAGHHELHEGGQYYIMDTSSVFAASPLYFLNQKIGLVFDACASPGGKGIFAWKALRPDLLIANEFVEKRIKILISNLKRCQIRPTEVFHLSTRAIGERFEGCFPVVLADVPCSGQSLILKGEKVPGAFHSQTINGNSMRQRRIVAELLPAVAPGGYFLYMTCTFSDEENEKIIEWAIKKFPNFQTVQVPGLESFQSHLTKVNCYRLWPQSGWGAGAFTALLQNTSEGHENPLPAYKPIWSCN